MHTRTILLLLLLLPGSSALAQKSSIKAIRAVFNDYKTHLINDNGEKAVECVDANTISYYDRILELVRSADSASVAELPVLDKLNVLAMRYRIDKEHLINFNGRQLFIHAINAGMTGKGSFMYSSVGEVVVDGTSAQGRLVMHGQNAPFTYTFHNEVGQWKMDLTSSFEFVTIGLTEAIAKSGKTGTDFLLDLLTGGTGEKPGAAIWVPTDGR